MYNRLQSLKLISSFTSGTVPTLAAGRFGYIDVN
jgi:hypothetical protein